MNRWLVKIVYVSENSYHITCKTFADKIQIIRETAVSVTVKPVIAIIIAILGYPPRF
ncbi:MAG: hypothetical protein LBR84_08740 [Tannerella sp.]|nr:hypothetical protein [Tannerella sp.]